VWPVRTACSLLAAALLLTFAPLARAAPRVGQPPLSDAAAAPKVVRSPWEPRPRNAAATHRVPTAAQLAAFHRQSDNPYAHWVTGRFRGTTDEVMQWAAAKWGLSLYLVRAVGATYRAADLWGSMGAWFSGRWHDAGAEGYVKKVKGYLRRRVWRTAGFAGGG
jgi:hypothetical protein